MRYIGVVAGALFILVYSSGCGDYQKVLKSDDTELKYERAMEHYHDQDYFKAIQLLRSLRSSIRATEKAEDVHYYFAYAHYKNKEYILASYYFRTFVNNFPASDRREESLYLAAYCKYLQAPAYFLDQTVTRDAIDELRLFTNRYPQSERVREAQQLVHELNLRLEKKAFEKARLYYQMERWREAAYALQVFLTQHPASQYREEALFYILESKYNYASQSIEEKREPRLKEALRAYDNLLAEYPRTRFKSRAERVNERTKQELESISKKAHTTLAD